MKGWLAGALLLATTTAGAAGAADAPVGTVGVPAFMVPFSSLASPEAKAAFVARHTPSFAASPLAGIGKQPVAEQRAILDRYYMAPMLAKARARYAVTIRGAEMGGVYVDVVEPEGGVPKALRRKVLLNLHGGGFALGARTGGQLEAIPLAGVGKYRVVAVDYRQGPEHRFPAASEDVAAVYRALLKEGYRAEDIGIYGCSAGGLLAAEAVGWFQKEGLPRPGALGIFCASAGLLGAGDSHYVAPALNGALPPPPAPDAAGEEALSRMAYFAGADARDPLVSPLLDEKLLATFPPTLLLTATRDFAMSSAIETQRRLTRAGVVAELHLWDGLPHFFFGDVDLPESREAYAVMAAFFGKYLGK